MEILLVHPQNEAQAEALKVFMKAFDVPFETESESPYNSKFVEKIKRSEAGSFTSVKVKDLNKFIDNL